MRTGAIPNHLPGHTEHIYPRNKALLQMRLFYRRTYKAGEQNSIQENPYLPQVEPTEGSRQRGNETVHYGCTYVYDTWYIP